MRQCLLILCLLSFPCLLSAAPATINAFATIPASRNHSPQFSPDGRHIAFLKDLDAGHVELWVMPADGTHPRMLFSRHVFIGTAEHTTGVRQFRWLPDSSGIICTRWSISAAGNDRAYAGDLCRIALDGTVAWQAQIPGHIAHTLTMTISPDGWHVADCTDRTIYLLDARDGKPEREIAAGMGCHSLWWGRDRLYCAVVPLRATAPQPPLDLYAATPDGQLDPVIETPEWEESSPSVSPDGQWLAFLRYKQRSAFHTLIPGQATLVLKQLATGEERKVVTDAAEYGWLADGRVLVARGGFMRVESSVDLFTMDRQRILSLLIHRRLRGVQPRGIWLEASDGAKEAFLPATSEVLRYYGRALPDVSPDGHTLAYEQDGTIYLIDLRQLIQ